MDVLPARKDAIYDCERGHVTEQWPGELLIGSRKVLPAKKTPHGSNQFVGLRQLLLEGGGGGKPTNFQQDWYMKFEISPEGKNPPTQCW